MSKTNSFFLMRGLDGKGLLDLSMANKNTQNTIVIPGSSTIQINFPKDPTGAVSVSGTGVTGTNVVVTDFTNGLLYFTMPAASSGTLLKGAGQNIDVLITASSKTYVYEFYGVLDVVDPVVGN
jgi:hypothetical protein